MRQIGASAEIIKNLIKNKLPQNQLMVDDLFALGLENCKNSNLQYCLMCPELITSEMAKSLADFYESKTECYEISLKTYERISSKENGAGIILVTEIIQHQIKNHHNLVLVCDGLEISGNIGTIMRTCEAVKVDLIVFTNIKAKIINNKILHASRGMIFNVPFVIIEKPSEVDKYLDEYDFKKIVCEPEQGVDFKSFDYSGKLALIVGSERYGVDKYWFESAKNTHYLKITMFGEMDSLNVGVATSLILYEAKYFRS